MRTADFPYELLETIPTNTGRRVHIARTPTGERVLVKRAYTDEWARDLQEQARHFRTLAALLGTNSVYPEVVEHADRLLVLRFYEHGSLDDLSLTGDPAATRALTRTALHALFRVAASTPPDFQADAPWRQLSTSYLTDQASRRVDRLDAALRGPARDWAAANGRGATLAHATSWITDGTLARHADRLGPWRLALAAHGDFGLNNVMLVDPPTPAARVVFIDTRGIWHGGYPWWDPIMDLATLIAFHCRIEPALAAAGERAPEMLTSPARLAEAEIRAAVADDQVFAALTADDLGWRDRLEVEIAIRLLGNVSVQLLTAPQNPERRADAVLQLYLDQSRRVAELLAVQS